MNIGFGTSITDCVRLMNYVVAIWFASARRAPVTVIYYFGWQTQPAKS